MQHPIVPLLPAEFSDIGTGSSSFVQYGKITKGGIQGQNRTNVQLAEKALATTVFLEIDYVNGQPLECGSGFFVQHDQIATNFPRH